MRGHATIVQSSVSRPLCICVRSCSWPDQFSQCIYIHIRTTAQTDTQAWCDWRGQLLFEISYMYIQCFKTLVCTRYLTSASNLLTFTTHDLGQIWTPVHSDDPSFDCTDLLENSLCWTVHLPSLWLKSSLYNSTALYSLISHDLCLVCRDQARCVGGLLWDSILWSCRPLPVCLHLCIQCWDGWDRL